MLYEGSLDIVDDRKKVVPVSMPLLQSTRHNNYGINRSYSYKVK
jgi:hypothetical protein